MRDRAGRKGLTLGELAGSSVGGGFRLPVYAAIEGSDPDVPYDVTLRVELRDRRYECDELICRRKEDGPPVTTDGIRSVPVGRIIADALGGWVTHATTKDGTTAIGPVAPSHDEAVRVAAAYRLAYACGLPPRAEVARMLDVSPSVAGNRIMAARKAGLLDPTERGKAGG